VLATGRGTNIGPHQEVGVGVAKATGKRLLRAHHQEVVQSQTWQLDATNCTRGSIPHCRIQRRAQGMANCVARCGGGGLPRWEVEDRWEGATRKQSSVLKNI
jgi:hypothetical protein